MVNSVLQVVGFCLGLIGWGLTIVTTLMRNWSQSDLQRETIQMTQYIRGLWEECQTFRSGYNTCAVYDSFFLGLPTALQVARACACISIVLGFFSTLLSAFGLECTTVAADNNKLKAKLVLVSGFLQILVGVTIGIAVTWYSRKILQSYYEIQMKDGPSTYYNDKFIYESMVYGPALFVGWVAMVISCLGGIVLCCSSWEVEEEDRGHAFTYNPPRPKTAAEYI